MKFQIARVIVWLVGAASVAFVAFLVVKGFQADAALMGGMLGTIAVAIAFAWASAVYQEGP